MIAAATGRSATLRPSIAAAPLLTRRFPLAATPCAWTAIISAIGTAQNPTSRTHRCGFASVCVGIDFLRIRHLFRHHPVFGAAISSRKAGQKPDGLDLAPVNGKGAPHWTTTTHPPRESAVTTIGTVPTPFEIVAVPLVNTPPTESSAARLPARFAHTSPVNEIAAFGYT